MSECLRQASSIVRDAFLHVPFLGSTFCTHAQKLQRSMLKEAHVDTPCQMSRLAGQEHHIDTRSIEKILCFS